MKKQKFSGLLGNTRAARAVSASAISLVLVLVLLISANVLFGLLPTGLTKPNATGSTTFQISSISVGHLDTLDEDVTLYFICNGGKRAADDDLLFFLSQYEGATKHLSVQIIDPATNADFIASRGGTWPSDMSVIVESSRRYKILDISELYYYVYTDDTYGNIKLNRYEYDSMISGLLEDDSTGQSASLFSASTTPYFDGESRVTNAINYVTADRVATAYVLTGNGCAALDTSFATYVANASFDLLALPTLTEIPSDCDTLLINAPSTDLTAEDAAALSTYLANAGKLLLTTLYNAEDMPNLASVLATYGLKTKASKSVLCEGNSNHLYSASSPTLFYAQISNSHPITSDFDKTILASGAHAIEALEADGATHTKLLYTSKLGYLYDLTQKAQVGEKSEQILGISAQKGDSEIVWLADVNLLNAQVNTYSLNGNFDLVLKSLNHLSGVWGSSVQISARAIETPVLAVTSAQFLSLGVILILVLPIAVGAIGVGTWYVRKKR